MAVQKPEPPVSRRRAQRGWSQAELARRADIPRTTISAIEGERLTPSVTTALALAHALECSVEELFSDATLPAPTGPTWAWMPRTEPCRYWEAEVGGRRLLYPVESLALNVIPHDGVWRGGPGRDVGETLATSTLVLACCDPAAGLLAAEYARASGLRLIVFPRSGGEAIDLLKRGLVHLAGLHRSTQEHPERNLETVREELGNGFRLVRVADWQEGLALRTDWRARSPSSIARQVQRWALRETGSAARECLDQLHAGASGQTVHSHGAVAEAIRGGWAEAGVCVRLSAEESGLNFLPVRTEALDFCFSGKRQHDPRLQALLRLLRSRSYRQMVGELPGYDVQHTGEVLSV
ncbi:MAG: helix-turn-helix domain-containing protein [Verrucomicrobiae bacterium]|nr:helix-turn-helix domain-containing protein [Verrucomicrobiae bacterium]